LDIADLRQS